MLLGGTLRKSSIAHEYRSVAAGIARWCRVLPGQEISKQTDVRRHLQSVGASSTRPVHGLDHPNHRNQPCNTQVDSQKASKIHLILEQ